MYNSVSIVIPIYNEIQGIERTIDDIYESMEKSGLLFEVILVDDGSNDGTSDVIKNIVRNNLKKVTHPVNRGYGASIKSGIDVAQHELIVITDADNTYPAESIPKLLEMANGYDMVVGARNIENQPYIRRPAKWFLRNLASYLAGQNIPDLNSGLRVMRKSIVKKYYNILPSGFSFTTTITLALLCNDYLVSYYLNFARK